jgi:hypothetical protein
VKQTCRTCTREPSLGTMAERIGGIVNLLRVVAVAFFLVASGSAVATNVCTGSVDHASERACLERQAAQSKARVTAAQAEMIKRIQAWDEDQGYKAETLRLFRISIDQYFQYRTARCDFERSAAAGGNGAEDMTLECQIDLDDSYMHSISEKEKWFKAQS